MMGIIRLLIDPENMMASVNVRASPVCFFIFWCVLTKLKPNYKVNFFFFRNQKKQIFSTSFISIACMFFLLRYWQIQLKINHRKVNCECIFVLK